MDTFPSLRKAVLSALDVWYQFALLPFRRVRRWGSTSEQADIVKRTGEFNAAAETYFSAINEPTFLLNKPFSDLPGLPKHLIDAGVMIRALQLAPGDVVLEFGAGSCWLSHMLNRYGCTTISVDVSTTAIELGRQLFASDPRTDWSLAPRFLVYDGHRIPIDDASCDRIVVYDAFHHVPNQREVLSELVRVLRSGGMMVMSEPGRGHGAAATSLNEAARWGVLENELVIEDVAALARASGFSDVTLVAGTPLVHHEIDADDLGPFMGGKGFANYWKAFCAGLENHHYIVCRKGAVSPTTAHPSRLTDIEVTLSSHEPVRTGVTTSARVVVTNTGDTRWMSGKSPVRGWTRLGAHLYRAGDSPALLDFDWWRQPFPNDVPAGHAVVLEILVPALPEPGSYVLEFDVVVEGLTWFADVGSPPTRLNLAVVSCPRILAADDSQ